MYNSITLGAICTQEGTPPSGRPVGCTNPRAFTTSGGGHSRYGEPLRFHANHDCFQVALPTDDMIQSKHQCLGFGYVRIGVVHQNDAKSWERGAAASHFLSMYYVL